MGFDEITFYLDMGAMLARGVFFQLLRLRVPRMLFLGRGARIYGFGHVRFTGPMKVGHYSVIDARFSEGIKVGKNFMLGDHSIMRASGSRLFRSPGMTIGNDVSFGPFTSLGGGYGLRIGDSIIGGPYCSIHPENHIYVDPLIPIRKQGICGKGITIENDVWIGAKVTILDGSRVASGSIVAAGAVLSSQFPPQSLIGGVPAKVLRMRGQG
jgi:acetyltransferase-like isoleucine patch superfamily enzyme